MRGLNELLLKFVVKNFDLNNLDICQWAIFAIRNLLETKLYEDFLFNQWILESLPTRQDCSSLELRLSKWSMSSLYK